MKRKIFKILCTKEINRFQGKLGQGRKTHYSCTVVKVIPCGVPTSFLLILNLSFPVTGISSQVKLGGRGSTFDDFRVGYD